MAKRPSTTRTSAPAKGAAKNDAPGLPLLDTPKAEAAPAAPKAATAEPAPKATTAAPAQAEKADAPKPEPKAEALKPGPKAETDKPAATQAPAAKPAPKAAAKPAAKSAAKAPVKAAARSATGAAASKASAPAPAKVPATAKAPATAKPSVPAKPTPPAKPAVAAKPAPTVAKPAPATAAAAKPTRSEPAPKPTRSADMADEMSAAATKVPPQFRVMAEKNVEQAKKAYEQYVSTTERMLNTIEDATRQAWSGARDVNLRMLGFADANAKAGFDYAERMVKAKDVKEFTTLQQDYLKQATERMGTQMREIQQMASQGAKDALKAVNPKG